MVKFDVGRDLNGVLEFVSEETSDTLRSPPHPEHHPRKTAYRVAVRPLERRYQLMVVVELGLDIGVRSPKCRLLTGRSRSTLSPDQRNFAEADPGIVDCRLPSLDDIVGSGSGMDLHTRNGGRSRMPSPSIRAEPQLYRRSVTLPCTFEA